VRDYLQWHDEYREPGSPLRRRLDVVIRLLGDAVDRLPAVPIRVISVCAGQGADVLFVAEHHRRGGDLVGRLVELDGRNAAVARQQVERIGADALEVIEADAGGTDAYVGAVPADLLVVCGVFGNITIVAIERTIRALPSLCAPGARAVWTRHPRRPEVLDAIRGWLAEAGFENEELVVPDDAAFGVGSAHLIGPPTAFAPGQRLFDFVR